MKTVFRIFSVIFIVIIALNTISFATSIEISSTDVNPKPTIEINDPTTMETEHGIERKQELTKQNISFDHNSDDAFINELRENGNAKISLDSSVDSEERKSFILNSLNQEINEENVIKTQATASAVRFYADANITGNSDTIYADVSGSSSSVCAYLNVQVHLQYMDPISDIWFDHDEWVDCWAINTNEYPVSWEFSDLEEGVYRVQVLVYGFNSSVTYLGGAVSNSNAIEDNVYSIHDGGPTYKDKMLEFRYAPPSQSVPNGIDPLEIRNYFLLSNVTVNCNSNENEFSVNVDAPFNLIDKPKIDLYYEISTSDYSNGPFTVIESERWNDISYIRDYKLSVNAETKHFKVTVHVSPHFAAGGTINLTDNEVVFCINRTGHIWVWDMIDPDSGKRMSAPATNIPHGQLVKRPPNLATEYKKTYDRIYGTNLNLNDSEVHHIIPLTYGGTNGFDNLIHLPKAFHRGVTGWWKGY